MFGEINNSDGERLDYSFAAASDSNAAGEEHLVVIGHGVTANKDREWATTLAAALNKSGFATLRFSFSGNGESQGDFRLSCPSKEVTDLESVLAAIGSQQVTYVGHSMGAAVGVLAASRNPSIVNLVSLAGMVETADFAQRKFGDQQPDASLMWEKPECPLSQHFMDDMAAIGSAAPFAEILQQPWLLVHGDADTVVPLVESQRITADSTLPRVLVTIEGADHVFSDQASPVMAEAVVHWLQQQRCQV
ncbi:MAG: alpha/beta fold hydrolase [Planctomycetes bacterium]|nr:alpha/beta fold hydrolase [Planctomycetota bacterium]MCP4862305.1 alpha/beta fold hydrolase [Planctomycetota bacterium]